MERDSLSTTPLWRRGAVRGIAVGILMVAAGVFYWRGHVARRIVSVVESRPARRIVPAGVRIRMEVLNATDSRGLARQAMFFLRDAGFDVVYFGTSAERSDSSIVLDRSGHAAWAALAAQAMSPARVEPKIDSSHFLDLTVLVGRNWSPPRETLYP